MLEGELEQHNLDGFIPEPALCPDPKHRFPAGRAVLPGPCLRPERREGSAASCEPPPRPSAGPDTDARNSGAAGAASGSSSTHRAPARCYQEGDGPGLGAARRGRLTFSRLLRSSRRCSNSSKEIFPSRYSISSGLKPDMAPPRPGGAPSETHRVRPAMVPAAMAPARASSVRRRRAERPEGGHRALGPGLGGLCCLGHLGTEGL